jgi:G3E family GTPase
VDATHGDAQLDQHPEAIKQVAVADRIFLTKTDLADATTIAHLRSRLATINPGAIVVESVNGQISLAAFFDTGLYQPDRKTPDVANWLRAEAYRSVGMTTGQSRHNDGITSMSVQYDEPLNWDQLIDVIEMLQAMRGDHLLRIKGIVNVAGEAKPRVLHAVQHTLYPATTLAAWPDDDHSTRLVFIVKDLDLGFVRASLDEFLHHRSLQPSAS